VIVAGHKRSQSSTSNLILSPLSNVITSIAQHVESNGHHKRRDRAYQKDLVRRSIAAESKLTPRSSQSTPMAGNSLDRNAMLTSFRRQSKKDLNSTPFGMTAAPSNQQPSPETT
jgi:hypothetical protein